MKNQFAVIGMGRFGSSLAKKLYELGYDVIAIDKNEDIIEDIADNVTYAVQADGSDMNTLIELGVKNVQVAVVAIGSDLNASFMTTINLKELGIEKIYAKAANESQAKVLYKIGADRVFLPERDMGRKVAHNIASNNILDLIELDPNHSIVEINTLPQWSGKDLSQLELRTKYGINVLAVKREGELNISPKSTDKLCEKDVLVVIGDNKTLEYLQKIGNKND